MLNVVVLIIDTLREDYGRGLEVLGELGFIKYENAIAPAPWTLPSHVSLITGMYPSQHGVHESYGVYVGEKMAELSISRLSELSGGILGELRGDGYRTYIISANPFITPFYGFQQVDKSIHLRGFLYSLSDAYLNDLLRQYGKSHIKLIRNLLREGRIDLVIKGAYYFIRSKADQLLARMGVTEKPILEKGSSLIMEILDDAVKGGKRTGIDLGDKFFLLINMMEAHAPYVADDIDDSLSVNAFLDAVFNGEPPKEAVEIWRRRYPIHSSYATRQAINIIRRLKPVMDNSLIIVTSDHGELLGDGGFSHGYFLEDGVLRVPLYIRWPSGIKPARQGGSFVSLTQLPSIIRSVAQGEEARVGARLAMAESFGSNFDYSRKRHIDSDTIRRVFSHRIRIYSEKGSFTYNRGTGEVEKTNGIDATTAKSIIQNIL
ncbi:MAG: sulfatase-like hydrolase/transferase [Thermocladium sp.]